MNKEKLLYDRMATTRELGRDASLVLAGGGNTSVKCERAGHRVMYIKASGAEMAEIQASAFTALDLENLDQYRQRSSLEDLQMMAALRKAQCNSQDAEASVESLSHAWIPSRFVDHSHADALLSVFASTPDAAAAQQLCAQLFGDAVVWVPFYASGFPLAQACAAAVAEASISHELCGLVLHHHGLMAFAETAEQCRERHQWMVQEAQSYLDSHHAPTWTAAPHWTAPVAATLCRALEKHSAGPGVWTAFPLDPRFAQLPDAFARASGAALTPGHALHIGPFPMWWNQSKTLWNQLQDYRTAYRCWATEFSSQSVAEDLTWPRTILCPSTHSAFAFGIDLEHAQLVAQIFQHNLAAKLRGSVLGPWYGAPPELVFAAETSVLERAKHARRFAAATRVADKE